MKTYISQKIDAVQELVLEKEAQLRQEYAEKRKDDEARIVLLKQHIIQAEDELAQQRLKRHKWRLYYAFMRYPTHNINFVLGIVFGSVAILGGYVYGATHWWGLAVDQGVQDDYLHAAHECWKNPQHWREFVQWVLK